MHLEPSKVIIYRQKVIISPQKCFLIPQNRSFKHIYSTFSLSKMIYERKMKPVAFTHFLAKFTRMLELCGGGGGGGGRGGGGGGDGGG